MPVSGDQWPAGLDLCVYDAGVNSGIGKALAWSRYTLNDTTSPLSHLAVMAQAIKDKVVLIQRFQARRLSFLHVLSTWSYFGRGWSARVSGIEAKATKMALQATGASAASVQSDLQKKATQATQTSAAAGGSATAAPAAPIAAVWHLPHLAWTDYAILAGIGILSLVVVAYLAHVWYVHMQRSAAFTAVAKTL